MAGTILTRGSDSIEIPYPYTPHNQPSPGQIMKRTPTNRIITAKLTGGSYLDKATLIRTYRITVDEQDDILNFLNVVCDEWTQSFSLDDPVDGMFQNVFADRRSFAGFRPFSQSLYWATLTYRVSVE